MKVLACPGGYYVYYLPVVHCYVDFAVRHSNCSPTSCGPLAQCTSDGGCGCISGYRIPNGFLPTGGSYGCKDIDECVEDPTICGPNATCTNTPGAHTCTCQQGYQVTSLGSIASASNPCQDIDECVEDFNICGPNGNCTNTVGAYNCTYQQGYYLIPLNTMASDSNPCLDVDECSEGSQCGSNAECYNTAGSYYCSCQDGYISSTGINWEFGVTLCKISSLCMSPAKGGGSSAEAASVLLKVSERLVSALVEPTQTQSTKTVKTPAMEINLQAIGPAANMTEIPTLNAKGNAMAVNLQAIAENNNGSAAAVFMSVNGMEKLMSSSFFRTENVTEMYSDIISATLPKTNDTKLPEPVNFTLLHKKVQNLDFHPNPGLLTCVYWEDRGAEKQWSVEGCTASFSNENYTVCSCSHLSTFALILQTAEVQVGSPSFQLLELVNLVCVCVGLAFLGLAILSFLLCSWNPKINNTARLHLCICLFLAQLLLLVGMHRTENALVCSAVAGILHFFFLSGFVWMLLETVQLYLLVRGLTKVQVIQREGLRRRYLLLIGYGAPLVVVGVSAGVFPDGYGSKEQCWLKKDKNFHWSFIGPVCSVLSVNWIMFSVILWSLRPTLVSMKSDISQAKDTRLIIFKILAQFFILGCAWILGFFQSTTMLKYLFIVLNSQQGTFIYIVHCLLNKDVREEYKRWLTWVILLFGSSSGVDPCVSHQVLSDPWRNIAFSSTTFPGYPLCGASLAGQWVLACSGGYYVYQLPLLNCYGNFAARYVIPTGFLPTGDSYGCIDIDECVVDPNICGPNATCANTPGAHTCTCQQGYQVTPPGSMANISNPCQDIDECVEDPNICGPNATCTNTPGAHTCTCQQGYRVTSLKSMASASNPCQDIDECVENSTVCGPNANCTNTAGAYTCTCHHGYHLMSPDSIASSSNPCQDVDECSQSGQCGSNAECYNTAGSYYCSCRDGYISSTGINWEFGVTLCKSK
ncbi:adhesion G protein-coupled receptor E1-like [Megalops cyprinoides]|uniref:adhesion G protein-coupled receptor E1-like n=1 Tax=Megalops cyprinoides TaxID=118141 RepID=UPI001864658B|nr:adhesion G protein-coupled receptor E1-like [Megalops cyprinoides]